MSILNKKNYKIQNMNKEELTNFIDEKLPIENTTIITGDLLNEVLTAIIESI
jgi:hypothetical protein